MQVRTLGKTGLRVPVIGFGASPLGGVFGAVEQDDATRAVRTALDLGVTYFDVSPFYGATRAEATLGRALDGVARDSYLLSTKVGRYGEADFDFSAARVTASIDESLARLGTEYVEILLAHDIEFGDLGQIVRETLPALRRIQASGKARFIGVSGLPLSIFTDILERTDLDVVLSYCHRTLYDNTLGDLTQRYLKPRGVGVINASPLGMGLLTDAGPPEWHPAPPELKYVCREAADLCRERGGDLARMALAWSVQNASIATTLVGMRSADEVKRNVAALDAPIDDELLDDVLSILEPARDRSWPSGRPENNG